MYCLWLCMVMYCVWLWLCMVSGFAFHVDFIVFFFLFFSCSRSYGRWFYSIFFSFFFATTQVKNEIYYRTTHELNELEQNPRRTHTW